MSRHYGKIFQLGYVVEDIEAAVDYWAGTLGVGPFFFYPTPINFISLKYYGEPVTEQVHMKVAMGYSGDTQIELIVCSETAPSPYRDFLNRGGKGLQHYGFITDNFDSRVEAAVKRGMVPALEGVLKGSRFCYLMDPKEPEAPMLELVDMQPERLAMFERFRLPSIGWDGTDPLRHL